MTDKIAWLEELLAQEPSSKQFFALARYYVQEDRTEDAVAVLEKGLSFHSEHFEARLLLIRCLVRLNDKDAAREESRRLSATLSNYVDFWGLWAEECRDVQKLDMALCLLLLGRHIQGEGVRWGEILDQGLRTVVLCDAKPFSKTEPDSKGVDALQGKMKDEFAPEVSGKTAHAGLDAPSAEPLPLEPESLNMVDTADFADKKDSSEPSKEQQITRAVPAGRIQARIPLPRPEDIPGYGSFVQSLAPDMGNQPSADLALVEQEQESQDAQQGQETVSEAERHAYETGTYADLLAEQGEIQEALKVYEKLLRISTDNQERRDLKKRIKALSESSLKIQVQTGDQPFVPHGGTASHKSESMAKTAVSRHASASKATELVQTLTRLAERLETRSQA